MAKPKGSGLRQGATPSSNGGSGGGVSYHGKEATQVRIGNIAYVTDPDGVTRAHATGGSELKTVPTWQSAKAMTKQGVNPENLVQGEVYLRRNRGEDVELLVYKGSKTNPKYGTTQLLFAATGVGNTQARNPSFRAGKGAIEVSANNLSSKIYRLS